MKIVVQLLKRRPKVSESNVGMGHQALTLWNRSQLPNTAVISLFRGVRVFLYRYNDILIAKTPISQVLQ